MNRDALLQALGETRQLLARPDNKFEWSGWENADAALREIDALIECVRNGLAPDASQVGALFAPTGPIQEASLSGGWADTFLDLGDRIDEAMR